MRSWIWIGRYVLVLLAAVALGAAIGELTVFRQTSLGTPKLPAAALAKFLGYGGALVIFALLGQRIACQLRGSGDGTVHLAFLVLPLTSLIVLSVGYDVVLAILHPFLGVAQKNLYNWLFVLAISASAVWLVTALYRHSEGLVGHFKDVYYRARSCESCGHPMQEQAKFCPGCGQGARA
jgi:serine/threonine-protein kinase